MAASAFAGDEAATRLYENRLTPIADPKPILADYPRDPQQRVRVRKQAVVDLGSGRAGAMP